MSLELAKAQVSAVDGVLPPSNFGLVNCGECWQVPGKPCTPKGDHVARFGRALRRGLVTGPELIAVLQSLDAFTSATIVCDVPGGVS